MTTSTKPTCFKIDLDNDKMYYNSKDLNEYNPEFYYGCKSKPKKIIEKKKIPESEYVYANTKLSEWKLTTADCKKSQLLISKEWVDKFYFKIETVTIQEVVERSDELAVVENVGITEETKEDVIEKAPPVLHLKDEEKFKDCDGNIIEIETRGVRHEDKIYFKVKDIMTGFGMPNLNIVLLNKDKGYERNNDYKNFIREIRLTKDEAKTTNKKFKTTLYLTYEGLLRVLFVSRNKNATIFRKWATNKLFTIQMGSKEEKIKLGTDVLNISIKTYKAVFDTYASKFPCIYLLSLGKVKDLRETFGIDAIVPDDSIVYKFGFTDDLERRLGEHQTKYGKLKNVNINLACFHTVDVKYTSEAEAKIREMTKAYSSLLNVDGYNELISLNKIQFEFIVELYESTGRKYMGNTAGLQKEIEDLKKEIQSLHDEIKDLKLQFNMEMKDKENQFIIDLKDKDKELLEKDLIIQKEIHEKNTLKTQLETNEIIYDLKLQLASKLNL
jgi:hypothetical protein